MSARAIQLALFLAVELRRCRVGEDWVAVGTAVTSRLAELGMTQKELADRSGLSTTTIRQIQHSYGPNKRSARTLSDISEALRWPKDYLSSVLGGDSPVPDGLSLRTELDELKREIQGLRARLDAIEAQNT
jgi:transcriptional regulator with XRE-family HTH domain